MINRFANNPKTTRNIIFAALFLVMPLFLSDASAKERICLRGVNIAGAEFGGYEGEYGKAYIYPSDATLAWAASKKMTAIRLPFRWERLQPELFGPFDQAELSRLHDTVSRATELGLSVVLDPHNFAEYRGIKLGKGNFTAGAFADFWQKLAPEFSDDTHVIYLLMNEPVGVTATTWFDAAQAAINAIRRTGADNLILVPGTIWTGASHWFEDQPGGSNAELFKDISDPMDNFAFEIHQYLDVDFSGTNATCPRTGDAISALKDVTDWMRLHGFQGYLGEFGGTSSPDCLEGISEVAAFINKEDAIWLGWAAWAAGDWWGSYPLSLQPNNGVDKPQMDVLEAYIPTTNGTAPVCGTPAN
ncbi:glycoside hydrolase family 5 protein [Labrenzia sp. PHM005]|uniref:glycoside hydrolase family 5 protein n=1 Tax=Labrenzia sp. PHM005 TaxID=2590016 RepID=UPI00113FC953|nr:glycoside hydrolase family 5 protein [Labrenzia sp. PHM005]QDG74571.1 glycoside hydrolase family 5 protein [Labrenzia sp. PHM005]